MSVSGTLTGLADEVRELSGESGTMTLDQMTENVSEANEEVSSQSDVISQIQTALTGKTVTSGGSAGPIYGRAVFFGDSFGLGYDESSNYSFIDMIAESGAFESVTKYCTAGDGIRDLNMRVNEHLEDIQNCDVVFLAYMGFVDIMVHISQNMLGFADGLAPDKPATICDALKMGLNSILSANPNVKIVWLAPSRWKGYSSSFTPFLLDSSGAETWLNMSMMLDAYGDLFMIQEATLFRIVKQYGGSIIDLGFDMGILFGEEPGIEKHALAAQTVIANPFRDEPLPALHRTITVIQQGSQYIAVGIEPIFLAYLVYAGGVQLTVDVLPLNAGSSVTFLPRFAYNGIDTSTGSLVFSGFNGGALMAVMINMNESADDGMLPVTFGAFPLTMASSTE